MLNNVNNLSYVPILAVMNNPREVMNYLLANNLEVSDYSSLIAYNIEMQNEAVINVYLALNVGELDRVWLYNNCEYVRENYELSAWLNA